MGKDRKEIQVKYNCKRRGVQESLPFPCIVREWPSGLFSVAMLVCGHRELLVSSWPVRNVSEAEARAVLEREL